MSALRAELVTTAGVRRAFLDYFQQKSHALLPGSPVLPLGDQSVPFVPAGMHQFRHVLLGKAPAPAPQVANSQRCIRIGGRHCDLATVGTDGLHLTFFEMLGSWTFGGSYWKREVCGDALNFLTGPLRVDPSRLQVTYFQGNAEVGADQECYDAWRSLGIAEDRIRACPASENMWEMGASGPCGPCTEIHLDGVEIWNLVFVQQERSLEGGLSPLEIRSIDTGMGLERLSALLAGRSSVYDTDTFQPLLEAVSKFTGAAPYGGTFKEGRDEAYRLLVDHARTISVALADGVVPDRHYKLRRIIRKCLLIAERQFGVENPKKAVSLLEELAVHTIANLSEAHPSLTSGIPVVKHLLHYEAELLSKLHQKEVQGWAEAVAEEPRLATLAEEGFSCHVILQGWKIVQVLAQNGFRILPGSEAYHIYDTHGIGLEILDDLAKFSGMQGVDVEGFQAARKRRRDSTRMLRSVENAGVSNLDIFPKSLPATDTTPVYSYTRSDCGKYVFPAVTSEVLAIVQGGKLVDEALPGEESIGVVLSRTNMYRKSGGQLSDHGKVETTNGAVLDVVEPGDVKDVVVHWGKLHGGSIAVGEEVKVSVDEKRRSALMKTHTAAHLFNGYLREHLTVATQNIAFVSPGHFTLVLRTYGEELTLEQLESVEKKARNLVKSSLPVTRKSLSAWNWHSGDPVTLIPDAPYPTLDLSVVEIGSDFRELCGGTHVVNTADIGDVCIVKGNLKKVVEVNVETGPNIEALGMGKRLVEEAQSLLHEANLIAAVENASCVDKLIETWKNCKSFLDKQTGGVQISFVLGQKSVTIVKSAMSKLEETAKSVMKFEVAEAASDRFVAVFVRSPCILKRVNLKEATRQFPNKAVLLVTLLRDGSMTARCSVPLDLVSDDFNASIWLAPVAKAFNERVDGTRIFAANVCAFKDDKSAPTPESVQLLVDNAYRFAEDVISQRVACV